MDRHHIICQLLVGMGAPKKLYGTWKVHRIQQYVPTPSGPGACALCPFFLKKGSFIDLRQLHQDDTII